MMDQLGDKVADLANFYLRGQIAFFKDCGLESSAPTPWMKKINVFLIIPSKKRKIKRAWDLII